LAMETLRRWFETIGSSLKSFTRHYVPVASMR
jgi:hypothetical protein